MLRTVLAFLFLAVLPQIAPAQTDEAPEPEHIQAEMVAEVAHITPGKPFRTGVHLKIAPGWHTYWINSGDSGLPISVEWELPPGWKAGNLQWPLPEKHVEQGDMLTYGYNSEVFLMAELTPPANLPPGAEVALRAKVSWLVCDQSCVPGNADLSLKLPVANADAGGPPPPADQATLFSRYGALLPRTGAPPYPVRWEPHDTEVYLKVSGLPAGAKIDFYPATDIPRHPELLSPDAIRIPLPKPPEAPFVQGLLIVGDPATGTRSGWYMEYRSEGVARPTIVTSKPGAGAPPSGSPGGLAGTNLSLSRALLFGLLGGLILNLMPCVLPVIGLKVFSFVNQAGESRRRVFGIGLAFFAGIFAWFMVVAALISAARAAGHELTWAFQFQNAGFVLGMTLLVFVFALNLLGLFEIWLPGMGRFAALSSREGYGGAFLHGAFATLLATPCTGPLLGPVLPVAFSQSTGVSFAMFASIAVGMGLPYLILAAQPGWMRLLPKPGPWMVRLRQVVGFLLLGTVVWLLGVLFALKDKPETGVLWILLGVGLACWIFGNWVTPGARPLQRGVALVAMAGVILLSLFFARPQPMADWEAWSPERVAALREEGKPVFIDFTASWCFNCKYNERFILSTNPVQKALRGFVTLKADWTRGDPKITEELKRLGRRGIPVYAVYPAGGGEAEVLPELLTQGTVIEALEQARAGR